MTNLVELQTKMLNIQGGGMKCNKLQNYSVKKLREYAIRLNLKITKKQGNRNINISKDELIKKIVKNRN